MIENVTLHDVQLGEAEFDIYNSTNVQFTGNTNVGKVTTCNAAGDHRAAKGCDGGDGRGGDVHGDRRGHQEAVSLILR